jgi:predicted MFS family arabinose efflux permease
MQKIPYCCCAGIIELPTTEFGVLGILPQLASYYHLSMVKAGWLLSTFALFTALARPFTAFVTSSSNRRPCCC